MIFDRQKQRLLLEGKEYTPGDIHSLVAEGEGNHPSAIWDLYLFLNEWFNDDPVITVHTSGSTGAPKELLVRKDQMIQSARLTCEFLDLKQGETALLCMDTPLRFAAMVPLQVYNTFQIPEEKEKLKQTEILIIGGGAVDKALEEKIRNLSNAVYSTYGMTETLSHIALRRLNGAAASDRYYPFSSVELFLSSENTLMINAPLVCDDTLQTNDIARIYPDGSFTILGRKDNVINSGGIKVQAEEIEAKLHSLIMVPYVVTCIPDIKLGEAIVLLMEQTEDWDKIERALPGILPSYCCPKQIKIVDRIPQTENGKVNPEIISSSKRGI